jgi:transcriptional regulator with XRE-family HTH domain
VKLDPSKVREAREQLGLSLDGVAKAAGVSQASAIRAEHGKEIRPLTARRIAGGLGVEVADLYPKAVAPTSSSESKDREEQRVIDMPQDVFRRTLSEASEAGDEALIELYTRLDAERINAELHFREDEANHGARSDFIRSIERRMLVFLRLVERGVRLPDPEQLSHQVEQLEELQLLRR